MSAIPEPHAFQPTGRLRQPDATQLASRRRLGW
jgi:hypothetical protein